MNQIIYKISLLVASIVVGHVSYAANLPDVLNTPAMMSQIATAKPLFALAKAEQRLVAVGQRGHILYSDNQGAAWQQAKVPVSSDLTAVYFVSANKGWAVGHDGTILATTDKGLTWQKQLDGWQAAEIFKKQAASLNPEQHQSLITELERIAGQGADKSFLDVWFANENTGFVVGAFGLALHTKDGGKTWQSLMAQVQNPNFLHLYAITGHKGQAFIAGEQGTLLKWNDSNQTFDALNSPYKGTFFGLLSASDVLLAYGLRGNLIRSTDNGTTWRQIDTYTPAGLVDGAILENGQLILVSQRGDILLSKNQGVSFYRPTVNQRLPFTSVLPLNKKQVVMTSLKGVKVEDLK